MATESHHDAGMPSHGAHEQNRLDWNVATERHNLHKDDQAAFFSVGFSDCVGRASGLEPADLTPFEKPHPTRA